jgi:hypothetical protein
MLQFQSIARALALTVVLTASAAPIALAGPADLRSPDARDAAQNLRDNVYSDYGSQDLRSPDAKDAAEGRGTFSAPDVSVITVPQRTVAADGGIDWRDVGIGAGAAVALMLLAVGGTIALVRRRHGTRHIAAAG